MRKWIVVLFFALLGENLLFAQAVVDSPAYEFRTTGRYRIGRVELSKQVTKLWLINEFIPGWWVEFSQRLYLEDPVTGQEYHPTELEGLKWGERKTTPECGVDTFVFTFPPLPETLKKVNWGCGPDNIYGIVLRDDGQKITPLMKIQGNWWTTDRTNHWKYGIYPGFIIANNRFWDYRVVKESSCHIILKQPTCPLPEGKTAGYFQKIIEPYKGKVIFVDFGATSCGPCCAGIKAMKPLRESYKGKDVVFLFITDEGSSPLGAYNKVMADVEGEKLRLTRNDYNYLQELFQFSAIPYYVIINKKREVVNQNYYRSGYRELFDRLLA